MDQRTDEWFASRLGKATASRIADIIAKTKTGPSASRENYAVQLVLERITQTKGESYSNAAMQWGTETEPLARQAYELKRGLFVDEVGFIDHPTIANSGASPDGLVGTDGLVEIKCPNSATHMETLVTRKIPQKYIPQMTWQMACTGRSWCDFVSFDPRFPENLQIFIERIEYDPTYVRMLELEVTQFLDEVEKKVEILRKMK
ncbi:phage_rel_nuc, putative phage-type endonuclease [uncultured Caudovirales phage]|uniref:Phage_rel_nuc, putative phage-type endonuclease n=1 Tax=uncultured Caudovirales phage TaxID=2100421 RepID=A0A6J5L365_9CAUD|nr:phage_rel_nuc, putative phage-type endonuclease [uncultured Caudovirales phage]